MSTDVIKLLPDSVANQIAAGEVIQRPASVIKELVENAIDAGATEVKIIVKDAGRTLIQVVDNGCGMSETDARMAFERHSTSKIHQADDLFTLHTMGFRGEALASIAAVAQVDLRTMRHGDSVGTRLVISGSRVESQQPEACAPGSNMMVRNLFFNVPARRKFLKKDSVELANIVHEFERLALVNTDVAFTLIHNDATVHQLLRGSFKQRICELFGSALERQLLPVETETSMVSISGFVVRPENAKRRGALQYFMVNGRNMRHPFFHKAVMQCYEELIASDMQPSYFLKFDVDPATIDVNIHPQKHEIKFENELPIRQILVAAVRECLGRFNAGPSIDFDTADAPHIPPFRPDPTASAGFGATTTYNPFTATSAPSAPASRGGQSGQWQRTEVASRLNDWEKLYENFANRTEVRPDAPAAGAPVLPSLGEEPKAARPSVQVMNRWLVTPAPDGMVIVDQHRAHVAVLFARFMEQVRTGDVPCQRLMFPEVLELGPSQNLMMQEIADSLGAMGFDVAYLGNTSWSINGMPGLADGLDPKTLLSSLIADLLDCRDGVAEMRSNLDRAAALRMAREKAVKGSQMLTPDEQQQLLADFFALSEPQHTPDGLITMRSISARDIGRIFDSGIFEAAE